MANSGRLELAAPDGEPPSNRTVEDMIRSLLSAVGPEDADTSIANLLSKAPAAKDAPRARWTQVKGRLEIA
jgi:hypothetical protein